MSRKPMVERDPINGALTYESAAQWYRFLADEALFQDGDALLSDEYIARAEALGTGPQGSVFSKDLEEAIQKWNG